uniref:THAP domain-containing protein 1 n=1 Tax=Xiphophorus couchianus TaxID=32473 RepID=A0A3B5MBV5_9TELE
MTNCFCSVPGCSCGARKQPYLSYHSFPTDPDQRRQWIHAIRRDEGPDFCIKTGSTFVCSRHFTLEDFVSGSSISRLRSGAVPSLFVQTETSMSLFNNVFLLFTLCFSKRLILISSDSPT